MYIIFLSYKASVEKINGELGNHKKFLDGQFSLGNIHASGSLVPRIGGIMLSKMKNKDELEKVLQNDPFNKNNLADYDIIEFMPTRTCKELEFLIHDN